MRAICNLSIVLALGWVVLLPQQVTAEGPTAEYERAESLRRRLQDKVVDLVQAPTWVANSSRLWYRKSVEGGNQFLLVDASTQTKGPAFDHERLAKSLSEATKRTYTALRLPFTTFEFVDEGKAVAFNANNSRWKVDLNEYKYERTGAATTGPGERGGRGGQGGNRGDGQGGNRGDGQGGNRGDGQGGNRGDGQGGNRGDGQGGNRGGEAGARGGQPAAPPTFRSPDTKNEVLIRNFNVWIRPAGGAANTAKPLTYDGSEGFPYVITNGAWSPDSKKLAVTKVRPAFRRVVHLIESSPADQVEPKHREFSYAKAGDVMTDRQPVLINVDTKKQIVIDRTLFPNPYSLSPPTWWSDGRGFRMTYNERNHQVYRLLEVHAETGAVKTLIEDWAKTFISYNRRTNATFTKDSNEVIWMSERDGWCQLYLYDALTGRMKNRITNGCWVVRGITRVDEKEQQIYFTASGCDATQDPYFVHSFRVNFDGTGMVPLTEGNGNHTVSFSRNNEYYLDTWSRVDLPPVVELRRTSDQKVIMQLEKANCDALKTAGWRAPEVFVSKARDGKTDIWGVIHFPTNFDPAKKYPVIEHIYSGPTMSSVPKTFAGYRAQGAQAELGFIVVQIDGLGTGGRSKEFQDYVWKNMGDCGFPDRVIWHKAVAAKYPWYDLGKGVGVYGGSAGGMNSVSALLNYPDTYTVAVAAAGNHDPRLYNQWYDEQFMGWPVGPEYSSSSNVDNAAKLKGKLLLIAGEMDTNVLPQATLQVVNALIKANKVFDLLYIPGAGHSEGGVYGERKRWDFFVQHLMGAATPDRNKASPRSTAEQEADRQRSEELDRESGERGERNEGDRTEGDREGTNPDEFDGYEPPEWETLDELREVDEWEPFDYWRNPAPVWD